MKHCRVAKRVNPGREIRVFLFLPLENSHTRSANMHTQSQSTVSQNRLAFLLALLSGLTAFAPFVTDMYLPSLPSMTTYFNVSTSEVQLGLTTSMVGLADGLFGNRVCLWSRHFFCRHLPRPKNRIQSAKQAVRPHGRNERSSTHGRFCMTLLLCVIHKVCA